MEKTLRISLLLLICLQFFQLYAQSVDELMAEGRNHLKNHQNDSAIIVLEQALETAEKNDLAEELPIIENNLAVAYKRNDNYPLSIKFYESALVHFLDIKDDSAAAIALYNVGLSQKKIGLNDAAIENFSSAIEIFQVTGQKRNEAFAFEALGNLFSDLELYEEAVTYHNNALSIFKESDDTTRIARVYNNLAQVYLEQESTTEAYFYLKEGRRRRLEHGLSLASNGILFGELFLIEAKWDSAYAYLKPAHNERLANGYSAGLASSYLHLGNYYHLINENAIASVHLDSAYAISDSIQHNEILTEVILLQLKIELGTSDQKHVLDKFEKLLELRSQALGESSRTEAARFDVKYETLKKDETLKVNAVEIELQKVENENLEYKYQSAIIALVIGLILLLIIIILGMRLRKKNANLKSKNDTINVLHKELRHRTKNYYSELIGMLGYDLETTENRDTQEFIDCYIWRLRAMSLIQSHLIIEESKSNENIALKPYLSELTEQVSIALSGPSNPVEIKMDFSEIDLNLNSARSLGIVLNELLQNAFKHGFAAIKEPVINIELSQLNDNEITLLVKDNGRGIQPKTLSKNDSEGMGLLSQLLKKINGTIEYNLDVAIGTEIRITIPA